MDKNKNWGPWGTFGDVNSKVKQHLIIDLEGRKVAWYTHAAEAQPNLNEFFIDDINLDTAFKDFGVWVMKLETHTKKQNKQLFRVMFAEGAQKVHHILITGGDIIQSKYTGDLEEIQE